MTQPARSALLRRGTGVVAGMSIAIATLSQARMSRSGGSPPDFNSFSELERPTRRPSAPLSRSPSQSKSLQVSPSQSKSVQVSPSQSVGGRNESYHRCDLHVGPAS